MNIFIVISSFIIIIIIIIIIHTIIIIIDVSNTSIIHLIITIRVFIQFS